MRTSAAAIVVHENGTLNFLLNTWSSLSKIERITAIIFKFYNALKRRTNRPQRILTQAEMKSAISTIRVTGEEHWSALMTLVKVTQQNCFENDIYCLKSNQNLSKKSALVSLSPSIDVKGVLRVGGRIDHGPFADDKKHPIILPNKHRLTFLLMEREHKALLHAAPLLLLAHIRNRFWPINGRNMAKRIYHQCITCFRNQPRGQEQLMGQLPAERITPKRPFSSIGVDFGGPIITLKSSGRGAKTQKSYICLFVCFTTRAVHIEAVSDLSTDAFLAALRRFCARRGCPAHIFSDQGKNFIGADNAMKRNFAQFISEYPVVNYLDGNQIKWHFIPQNSPHMGGIWEAGIKSAKAHLKRVMGNSTLTFEEFSTLLAQIEACLNSRPITPLSSDPDDLDVLTPGHFIIGEPLVSIPEPSTLNTTPAPLLRWCTIQQKFQYFWKRWSTEYINNLQLRVKWRESSANLQPDDLVLIKDDNLPPLKWSMGRVIDIHPGSDQLVRAVTLKTHSGIIQRTIHKLCKLPIDEGRI
jgi:hypothetical protein